MKNSKKHSTKIVEKSLTLLGLSEDMQTDPQLMEEILAEMKLDDFKMHMEKIVNAIEKSREIGEVFGCEGIIVIYDELLDSIVDLLQYHFKDRNDWINYWLWELDMGKSYKKGGVILDGKDVPLKTIEDLYNIIK